MIPCGQARTGKKKRPGILDWAAHNIFTGMHGEHGGLESMGKVGDHLGVSLRAWGEPESTGGAWEQLWEH